MPVSHTIILGIIQGLTEVFPISSSAHLFIFPWLFKWQYQGLSFDVALHLGTALAFIIYFFKDWGQIFRENKLIWRIIIGTIPAALAGLILEKKAEVFFRLPLLIAAMLIIFAIILFLADKFGRQDKSIEQMGFKDSLWIGFAQAIALIPGVSRSGITMTAGLFKGYSRQAAARFSFLLATPIVIAAGVLKLPKMHISDLTIFFWAGIAFSALSGYIGLYLFFNFIKKASLNIFVYYRIAFAILIATAYYVR